MLKLNNTNFKQEVLESKQPVLVVFSRPGCKACSMIEPIIKEVDREVSNSAKVGELNIYESPEIAKEYKIPAVPTFIIFKNGEAVERAVGARSKQTLIDRINLLV